MKGNPGHIDKDVSCHPIEHPSQLQASITLPTGPYTQSQAHLQGIQNRHTKANLPKEPALCQRSAQRTPADECLSSFVRQFSKIELLDTKAPPPPQQAVVKLG